jgi:TfoX-like protein
MAFDESLAKRVWAAVKRERGATETRMMGGWGLMLRGNLCCGVYGERLIVRVGPDAHVAALREPHGAPVRHHGPCVARLRVRGAAGVRTEKALKRWVGRGLEFVRTLPAKKK